MNFGLLHSTPPLLSMALHRKPPHAIDCPSSVLKLFKPPSPLLFKSRRFPSAEYSQKIHPVLSLSSNTCDHAEGIASSTSMDFTLPRPPPPLKWFTLGPNPGALRPNPPPAPAPPTAMDLLSTVPKFFLAATAPSLLAQAFCIWSLPPETC